MSPGPRCLTTLRCRLMAVQEPSPGVWRASFSSKSEEHPFELAADAESAQALMPYAGKELDVEMMYVRGEEREISSGEVRSFHTMWEGDALELWDTWVRESGTGAYWASVACIECELGRFCALHPEVNTGEG